MQFLYMRDYYSDCHKMVSFYTAVKKWFCNWQIYRGIFIVTFIIIYKGTSININSRENIWLSTISYFTKKLWNLLSRDSLRTGYILPGCRTGKNINIYLVYQHKAHVGYLLRLLTWHKSPQRQKQNRPSQCHPSI